MKRRFLITVLLLTIVLVVSSCGTTVGKTSVTAEGNSSLNTKYEAPATLGLKKMISVAKFTTSEALRNQGSSYENAAYDTLVNKLQATARFIVFEESEFDTLNNYLASAGQNTLQKRLAQYMIVGSVNSIANKTSSGSLFGLSTGKKTCEASVTLRLIDTATGQIVYSEEGKGTASNSSTGFSYKGFSVNSGGYDPQSLESQAIGAAIDSLIDNIIATCDKDPWQTEVFADSGRIYIVGGESIGLAAGKTLAVIERGGTITNPQTGSVIELPGEKVAEAIVQQTFPASFAEDEISLVTIINGSIDVENLSNYVIREND